MIKKKVFVFANTLWFINRFKSSLINDLISRDYEVNVVYFRKGSVHDLKNLDLRKYRIKMQHFFFFLIDQFLNKRKKNNKKSILLSFTIGPIILSSLPIFRKYKRFATLEGLGRIFTSKNIIFY